MSAGHPEIILVVEDDAAMRKTCEQVIRKEGFEVRTAESGEEAEQFLNSGERIRAVLTDLKLPGMDGLQVLKMVKGVDPSTDVIVMTGYATIQSAVDAMRLGATDYVTKPFEIDDLIRSLEKVRRSSWVEEEVERLRAELRENCSVGPIVAESTAMLEVLARVRAASRSDASVLIEGASGTGKELVARAIHEGGTRAAGPYIVVNCAAVPYDLVESELFGHRAGAFTGATRDSTGLFRGANGGTIFLDEVTEIPEGVQVKLLRVLQEKLVRPLGGIDEQKVDVRIIAAMNRSTADALTDGSLREDLYYRLSVIVIRIPPLRERPEDIAPLTHHFFDKHARPALRGPIHVDPRTIEFLTRYPWPGNARELENVVEEILAMEPSDTILPTALPPRIRDHAARVPRNSGGRVPSLRQAERELLERALKESGGNKSAAARILGISRQRLYRMARELDVRI